METVAQAARVPLRLDDCEGERCVADQRVRSAGLRVGTQPLPAFGAWAQLGGAQGQVKTASFLGAGLDASAGANLTWPRAGLRPSLGATLLWAQVDDNAASALQRMDLGVSLDLVAGQPEGEAAAWFGLSAWPLSRGALDLASEDLELSLSRRMPVGLQLGGELYSTKLGPSWRPRSPRMHVSAEAQLLSAWGLTLAVGASY